MSTEVQPHAGVVIIGAGPAGCEAAFALRTAGYEGAIDLIGRESLPPYRRPPLSKQFIAAETAPDSLLIKPLAAYAKAGINLRTSTEVVAIDRAQKTVTLDSGETIEFQQLIFATGGEARRLTIPGSEHAGVFCLRRVDDALAIRAQFQPGRRLVIVGGGFVGLEVAALAVQHGLQVCVLESASSLLARVGSPMISTFYEDVHRAAGIDLRLGVNVEAFLGTRGVLDGVQCSGARIDADIALVGVGLEVADALAASIGLDVDHGIRTNAECRTADPAIFAIGDCASSWRAANDIHMRLESVPNAIEQARIVAQLIAGKPAPEPQVPWFWSDQYDLKLQMAGLCAGHDAVVVRGEPASRAFMLFYLHDQQVIAVHAINRVGDFNIAKKLVAEQRRVPGADLADEAQSLKDIVGA